MAELNEPVWVELSSADPAASRGFYAKVLGWDVQVNPDPQYGGYAIAKHGDHDVAGIGPKQPGDAGPTAWSTYIGSADVDATAAKVTAAGGTVIAPPFDVPDQGRMVVFQDPSGAFLSAWQAKKMAGFHSGDENEFGWAELSARGLEKDVPFYAAVFGWTAKQSTVAGADAPPYTEFQVGGKSVAGAMEMNPATPVEVPSYWTPYFNVADVDDAFRRAMAAGAHEMVAPQDFPGGRFAILGDPQGAMFGVLKANPR